MIFNMISLSILFRLKIAELDRLLQNPYSNHLIVNWRVFFKAQKKQMT